MTRYPQIGDNEDAMVALLEVIARNTGGLGALEAEGDTIQLFDGAGVAGTVGAMDPSLYQIYETADLPEANGNGVIELEPGDETTIVETHPMSDGVALLAVGATDKPDVRYKLVVDGNRVVGGLTNSPLGTVNTPFSFVKQFGVVIPAERRIEYRAVYSPEASGEIEMAARMHVEALNL